MGGAIGLIAGQGRLPLELARSARRQGRSVVAVGLEELASPELAGLADVHVPLFLGELGRLFQAFREHGADEVVLAGKVPKSFLWERRDAVRPDAVALRALAELPDRADDSLLGAVVEALEAEGLRVLGQAELAPDLLATRGCLGRHVLDDAQWADVRFGYPIAKALGGVDVGQTVVVKDRAVLALEAIEGTDAAIARGCALGEPGATVVKVAKPSQDPRMDVPAIGADTVRALAAGGGAVLAVEAGATLVIEREETIAEADRAGIRVLGVDAADLADLAAGAPS